jgi:hypothetical protein
MWHRPCGGPVPAPTMLVMIEIGRLAHGGDECWSPGSWRADAWRRGRDVLDAYDDDRVLSEELADELVNELAGREVHSRRRRDAARPWRPGSLAGTGVEGRAIEARVVEGRTVEGRAAAQGRAARRARPHLTLVTGGRCD